MKKTKKKVPTEEDRRRFDRLVKLELTYSELSVIISKLGTREQRKQARKIIKGNYSLKDGPHIHHGKKVKWTELIYVYPIDIINHILAEFGYMLDVKLVEINEISLNNSQDIDKVQAFDK